MRLVQSRWQGTTCAFASATLSVSVVLAGTAARAEPSKTGTPVREAVRRSLAEVLVGDMDPSERLPISWERSLKDNPSIDYYYPTAKQLDPIVPVAPWPAKISSL